MTEEQLWDLWHEFTENKSSGYKGPEDDQKPEFLQEMCPCCTRNNDHDSECELELWVLDFIEFIVEKTNGEQK